MVHGILLHGEEILGAFFLAQIHKFRPRFEWGREMNTFKMKTSTCPKKIPPFTIFLQNLPESSGCWGDHNEMLQIELLR